MDKGKACSLKYDAEEDILMIYLSHNRPCITYDLSDNFFVRVDPKSGEVVSLEFLGFLKHLKMKVPAHFPKELVSS